jgi:hypothetical protein
MKENLYKKEVYVEKKLILIESLLSEISLL